MNRCEEIRPLLFALLEGGVTPGERRVIDEHLNACRDCRNELEEERRLTAVLRPHRRRRFVPAVGIAAALLFAVLLFQPTDAYGSIEPQTLTPEMTLRDGERKPLQLSNHVVVPTGESCRIRVRGVGVLSADGPAVFELDRTDKRWKLTLLRGEVRAEIEAGGSLDAVTIRGPRRLRVGTHWICLDERDPKKDGAQETVAELMTRGNDAFFKREDMPAAEKAYRAAKYHPDATPAQKARAHFFLSASLGRQERWADAVKSQAEWLKLYPKDNSRHYVLLFHGVYHRNLGMERKATECWHTIIREAPKSDLAKHAKHLLGTKAEVADAGYQPDRVLPADAGKAGPYVVVTVKAPADFVKVAEQVAKYHQAILAEFQDFKALEKLLRRVRPRNVLFVVPPDVLDVNLHRQILLLSARIDDDWFADFAFGYFTARDAKTLGKLWERTRHIHENGLTSKRWTQAAVSNKCMVYPGSVPDIARAAGFTGDAIYWGYENPRQEMNAFVTKHLPELEKAGVITMTGCGDPQGTWLFSDRRNLSGDKHWDFEPGKVGHDPGDEMPRITADRIRALKLNSPIVWTGVCHAGATKRVFVEGDIVSTFGKTNGIATLYELDPDDSYCLAMIDAGAVAYICPIGANHGGSVSREVDFVVENGATLGEAIKMTYDEVLRAARGKLHLGFQEAGKPEAHDGYVMQGGGANRILIGDPALRPFKPAKHPRETVEIKDKSDTGFTVVVTWEKGYHARSWDMYRNDRNRDWCVQARVELDGLVPAGKEAKISAEISAVGADGTKMPYVMVHGEPEVYHGKRYLHLQASAPRKQAAYYTFLRAAFRVTIASSGKTSKAQ